MKIVHITDSMQIGGAEKLIALLCRFQREQGYDPSVHCLYSVGALGEQLRSEGFTVTRSAPTTGLMRSLYHEFRQHRPDVVHCHNLTATVVAAMSARLAGARSVVSTRHGLVAPPYSLRRELKFAVASRFCDWIVAVCDAARHNLRSAPFAARDKIVRVYNGVPALGQNGSPPAVKSGFTLLHVARLSAAKDQATLLRAVVLADSQVPDLKLWIVGDGPLRPELQSLADRLGLRERVTFFGEQIDVAPFFSSADVFVMSSITEGLPVSLLEAMSAGLPAVVTDVGGMGEVVRRSGAGSVVPALDERALAEAIRRIASDHGELSRLRTAAQHCYEREFTLKRMAAEYVKLYGSCSAPEDS
jgi:glycosyltransferase involved in cell wall biosynthesis